MQTLSTPAVDTPVRTRVRDTSPPEGAWAKAPCGCVGEVIFKMLRGPYPYVSLKIMLPHTGHSDVHLPKVAAGVIERWTPDQITAWPGTR